MVAEIIKQFQKDYNGNTNGFEKYFHVNECISVKKAIFNALDIPPNSSILDIASGFGYFPYICKEAGHKVTVTDVCEEWDDLCTQAREVLGLPKAIPFAYNDRNFKPLPKIGKFDLITAFACSPHSFFSVDEWKLYIEDCKTHLNNKGKIYVEPNTSGGWDNLATLLKPLNRGFIYES